MGEMIQTLKEIVIIISMIGGIILFLILCIDSVIKLKSKQLGYKNVLCFIIPFLFLAFSRIDSLTLPGDIKINLYTTQVYAETILNETKDIDFDKLHKFTQASIEKSPNVWSKLITIRII